MSKFGGGAICPRCSKTVYANESVNGPSGGSWHKACMTCKECNKRLDSMNLTEKDGEAYCKTCYGKLYGPKGYGYGGGAGTLSTDSTITSIPRSESGLQAASPSPRTSTTTPSAPEAEALKKFVGSDVCPNCSKQVYFAEQQLGPGGIKYHKSCFKCTDCGKRLDSTLSASKDNVLYCKACHGKKFGPKGYGFGGGSAFLTVD
ncbi:hypothetical protein SmJEL517_g01835 [Synchytrium microbalum]|uniref:LIM zinc-binding domain-containing protein n=1 Tax=Synchytrium microbalum TaxID=1806994 RepID=A0A507CEH9_9FUNG|nr:uncharacterized protein SmJEL517_g01835 [Synchytrium microbalum]TPX35985.1 hypothetical protein SmJEL517_g01835 [Synchytrium microbalum]